jgi:anti-sigma B factor antagonist
MCIRLAARHNGTASWSLVKGSLEMFTKPSSAVESKGRVMVGTLDREVLIQVEGRGTHLNSQPLRDCLIEMLQRGYTEFRLDLGGCSYMDSTFLGVLANICLQLKNRTGTFSIPRINQRNLELLQTLGIDRFFVFGCNEDTDERTASCALNPLGEDARPRCEWGQTVLEAHQSLVRCDPSNAVRFKDVIQFLEEDLKKSSPH